MVTMDLFSRSNLDARANISWTPPAFPNLRDADPLVVDVESTGLKWFAGDLPVGIAIGTLDGMSWYLPFAHAGGNLPEETVKEWLIDVLAGKNIIGHNIKFDCHMLREWGIDLEALGCHLWDTGHCIALLDDNKRRGFSLDELSKEHLEIEGKVEKTAFTNQLIDIKRMATYHAGEIAPYARRDVFLTGELWNFFHPQIVGQDLSDVLQLESDIIFPICYMEDHPSRLDEEKLIRWDKESEADVYYLIKEVLSASKLTRFNTGSSQDWRKLFRALDVPLPDVRTEPSVKYPEGQVSFAGDVVKTVKHPIIQTAFQAKRLESMRNKYITAYLKRGERDRDGNLRIRTNFHQLRMDEGGTISGRFSSTQLDEETGANLQQVYAVGNQKAKFGEDFPYIIRELFISEPGEKWLSADAAQIEYRLFVHYARSPKLDKAYENDPEVNFHKLVMKMLSVFNDSIPYKHIKNINFAKLYGAGLKKIAEMCGLSLEDAQKFIDLYEREIPESLSLMDLAQRIAKNRGYILTILKRRARFPGAKRLHKAVNSLIQGSAADIMKRKIKEAYAIAKKLLITLQLTVHDELDGSCPSKEAGLELKKVLNEQTTDTRIPILWTAALAENWAECEREEVDPKTGEKVKVNEI